MNTVNTMTRIREDKASLAINKLELLNLKEVQSIFDYLGAHAGGTYLDIIINTGLDAALTEELLEKLMDHGFVILNPSQNERSYSLNLPYLTKVILITKKLSAFWK